ncbi:hypothetical protein HYH94_15085 [Clostridium botulinum]|nr:hypothetical protein [Clostridium botulinum]
MFIPLHLAIDRSMVKIMTEDIIEMNIPDFSHLWIVVVIIINKNKYLY